MATTIGRVEYNVVFDGRRTVVQARSIGNQVGQALTRQMDKYLTPSLGNAEKGLKRLNRESAKFHSSWKSLPHGFRQFSFYVALFASLGSEIAILGSAAGSGIVVLAGALGALIPLLGIVIAGFVGLFDEAAKLGPMAQAAKDGFGTVRESLSTLNESLRETLFANLEGPLAALAQLILNLTPAFQAVAAVANQLGIELLTALTSAQGFQVLNDLLIASAPIALALGQAFIQLGAAIGNILLVAAPFIQNFADALNQMFTEFNAWTQSIEGQTALAEWFQNGATIIEAILPLLAAAGTVLNGLVNPDTIALFQALMANLTTFLSVGANGILQFLAVLDPIGLIGQALADLSVAIQPAWESLMEVAAVLNGALSQAISTLAPIIGDLVVAFAPLVAILVNVAAKILSALLPALTPIGNIIAALAVMLTPIVEAFGTFLVDAINTLIPVIQPLLTQFISLAQVILPVVLQLFNLLAPIVLQLLTAFMPIVTLILPPLISLLSQVLAAIMPLITAVLELLSPILALITPLLELIGPILGPLIDLFVMLATAAIGPLTDMINAILIPIIEIVTDVFKDWFPVIKSIIDILSALITFIVSVFKGDWDQAWKSIGDVFIGIWNLIVSTVEGAINTVIDLINGLLKGFNNTTKQFGVTIPLIPKVDFSGARFASGGIVTSFTRAIVGEDGPEAIVPLARPLNRVDPSVRDLSAILQGKPLPSGGDTSNGGGIVVAEGAIQVIGVSDGNLAASATLDRFVAFAGG